MIFYLMRIKPPCLVLCLSALVLVAQVEAQVARQALKAAVTVLIGAGAAGSLANAAEAQRLHEDKANIVARLKSQGVDPRTAAIFSVYFTMNGDASAVYWADIIGKPDVFIVVAIEGHGQFLLPRIEYEYSGQPILERLLEQSIEPGRRVAVYVYDDDSASDTVWNNVLKTRITFEATADVRAAKPLAVSATASGSLQLLDSHVMLDKPDFIASAEFIAPEASDGRWAADGELRDSRGHTIGKIQFAQLWRADPAQVQTTIEDEARSYKLTIFWCGTAVVLALVFVKMLSKHGEGQTVTASVRSAAAKESGHVLPKT